MESVIAPEIVQLYALNIPAYTIRAKVRELFEKNSNVSDPEAVDILLLKGYQEFQEVMSLILLLYRDGRNGADEVFEIGEDF